jgi:hypothetical protein
MRGSCHCGAVELEVSAPPAEVSECNCSLCRRLGGLWAYYHPDEVRILRGSEALAGYVQGDRTLAVRHCTTCGCTTHWEPLPGTEAAADGPRPRMGVNARLLDGFDKDAVAVRKVDGASF